MKKISRRSFLAAGAACAAAGVLSACGASSASTAASSGASASSSAQAAPQQPVTLNFWHNYSAQSAENDTLMNTLIPKFQEENPGVTVNAVFHEWADLHDKILVSASSNSLPDVARLDIAWVPEFQKAGILTALDEAMGDFSDSNSALLESAMSTANIEGHYYALALNTNTKIMYYNQQAFDDAGLSAPATMDEFVADVKKLSGKNAAGQQVWGLTEPALAGWNVLPYIWSCGGSITSDDYMKATGYLNSAATVKAVQMLADMYAGGELCGFNSGDTPMTDGFGTGRYMMLLEGPWKTAEMAGAYPDFKYGTCEIPAGEGGSVSVLGGEDIGMFTSANQEVAWKFMQFMTDEFAQEEMAKCGQIPVNINTLQGETVQNADYAPYLEAITTAKARPPVASWSEIDDALTSAMTSIIKDGADVQKTLDTLAQQADALLAE
ncbi:MAG: extracellular solute-binding protein [Faecalibacterium sp.]|jgi:multiple sugar transport system substrate-binding protein|nr:extracellular solute-binding protein [Faecalibacterium sp.]